MDFDYLKQLDDNYHMHTYKRSEVCFVSGKGAVLKDTEGREYIDFSAGIGTSSLGYGDSEWVNAVSEQAANIAHCSNLYYNSATVAAAEKICKATKMSRVFFGNSGAEANEGAIKLARKYSFLKYGADKQRNIIITLRNSFHGRTVTTLSATGQDVFHNYFFPFTEGFRYCLPDLDDVKNNIDERVGAIMFETIQGEGGVLPLSVDFVSGLKKLADENDILLIDDEIQTGVGRTGKFLSIENYNVKPDIVTLAKGLAGGLPIGCFACTEKLEDVLVYGDHGSTFGGNPVACAGAGVVVDRTSHPDFLKQVVQKGEYLKNKLNEKLGRFISEIRGNGLMLGIDFKDGIDAKGISASALKYFVVTLTAKSSLRLLPPLVISYDEIDEGIRRLEKCLENNIQK